MGDFGAGRACRTARAVAVANMSDSQNASKRPKKGSKATPVLEAMPVLEATAVEADAADDDEWRVTGHKWIGERVRTYHKKKPVDGTITKWMPPGDDPIEDPALFHMAHDGDDDDGEGLEAYEVVHALKCFRKKVSVRSKADPNGPVDEEEEGVVSADDKEALCRRLDQCMKNDDCVRGFKHGSGPCRIRSMKQ